MKGKNQDINEIIDFVTANDSDLSGLSDSDASGTRSYHKPSRTGEQQ